MFKCKVSVLPYNGNKKWKVPSKYCDYIGMLNNTLFALRFQDTFQTTITVDEEFLNKYFELING
jgi:hypothetical protein